jgi:ATP/ADP translocase
MPKSLFLFLLFPILSFSQTLIGTVKDTLGNPLQNANVIAKPLLEKQGLKFLIIFKVLNNC